MKKNIYELISILCLLLTGCSADNDSSNPITSNESDNGYTIIWQNWDGSNLETDRNVEYGVIPSYDGLTPTRNEETQYKYTFEKWDPEIVPVTSDKTYTATFKSTLTKAKVSFDLNGGSSSSYVQYKYLDSITADSFFFDVTKEDYNFRGWSYEGTKIFDNKGKQLVNLTLSESMVFTAVFAQTAELTIHKSIENAGSVTGEGEYSYNTYVDVSVTPYNGYVFDGWYYQDVLLSKQAQYRYMIRSVDITLEARFKLDNFLLEVESYNEELGLVMIKNVSNEYCSYSSQRYDYTSNITISAYTETAVNHFLGWFDTDGNLIETNAVLNFTMPSHNYKLIAKWDLFKVFLITEDSNKGVVTGAGNYKSSVSVSIEAFANDGYLFAGWYDKNNSLISENVRFTFNMPTEDIVYTAKFTANSYSVTVSSEDTSKGTVLGSGTYQYNTDVTIQAIANNGYSFEGWYDGSNKVSPLSSFTFLMPFINVHYLARFSTNSYIATANTNSETEGTVTGTGSYEYKSSVTFTAMPNKGYLFEGWYDGSTLKSNDASYTFEMPCNNVCYTAKFTLNSYTVTVNSEDTTKGTVTGSGTYKYGSTVTLVATTATNTIENPYVISFDGWYIGTQCLSTSKEYSFEMPSEDLIISAKFSLTNSKVTTGDIMYHGYYPQTKVTDSSTIINLTSLAGTLPTSSDSQNWTAYNWYINSSNSTKFAWYIDLDTNSDDKMDYRGVYFTSYRPASISGSSSNTSWQYSNGYNTSIIYWFKYEPIEWRVLNRDTDDYLVMANKVLDSEQYSICTSNEYSYRTDYNGNTRYVEPINYEYSDLRKFLNVNFYCTAFNLIESNRIQITDVENYSCDNYQNTGYAGEITQDKVFALSYLEAYGLSSYDSRKLKATDYAECMGVANSNNLGFTSGDCCDWWLRTPYDASNECWIWRVTDEGKLFYHFSSVFYTCRGVVPALHLQ